MNRIHNHEEQGPAPTGGTLNHLMLASSPYTQTVTSDLLTVAHAAHIFEHSEELNQLTYAAFSLDYVSLNGLRQIGEDLLLEWLSKFEIAAEGDKTPFIEYLMNVLEDAAACTVSDESKSEAAREFILGLASQVKGVEEAVAYLGLYLVGPALETASSFNRKVKANRDDFGGLN